MSAEELKAQGSKAFSAGNYKEAIDLYSQAITLAPENHVLYSNRSAAHASLRDYEAALADANKTVEINPSWAKGYSRKGAALHGQGKYDEAIAAYNAGLAVEPTNAALKKGVEDAEGEKAASANPFASLLQGDIAAKLAANPKTAHFANDQDVLSKLNMAKANPAVASQFMQDPKVMQALMGLMGIDLSGMPGDGAGPGAADATAMDIEKEVNPTSTTSARAPAPEPAPEPVVVELSEEEKKRKASDEEKKLGNDLYKKRSFDEALVHYTKAYELDDTNVAVLTNKAAVLFEMENYDECIKVCETAVERGRETRADFKLIARAFGRIGNAYLKQDKIDEAIKYFNHSLTENRTADILTKLKETEKLKERLDKEAYFDETLSDEARARGNALFKESKYAEAVKEYTEAIKRNETDVRGYCNRAQCYIKLMALYEADKDANAAIDVDPNYPKGYIRKAQVLLAKREFAKAMEQLEKAKTVDTDMKSSTEINQQLQRCYQGLGQRATGGGESREETLKRAMADPEVQQALSDPVMQSILKQMQEDPAAAQEHLKNPVVAAKIRTLINAGVIEVR